MGGDIDKIQVFIKLSVRRMQRSVGGAPLPRASLDSPILISPLWSPVKVCGRPAGSHAGAAVTETRTVAIRLHTDTRL